MMQPHGPKMVVSQPRRALRSAALLCGLVLSAAVLAGCAAGALESETPADSAESPAAPHGGPAADVRISSEAMESTPQPWVLDTPEAAVRSYLDWVSYAFRTARAEVASGTMTTYQAVRDDSYIQYNIQKGRILDQTLDGITFGQASVGPTSTLVPVKERWSYRYVSIEQPGDTIGGPYTVSYDSTYTVVRSSTGDWQVDNVEATPIGEVK